MLYQVSRKLNLLYQRIHLDLVLNCLILHLGPLSIPLSDVEIRVGIQTDYKLNPMCGERVRQFGEGEVWTAECNPPIPGRYVSVSLVTKGQLIICEVAVFARLGKNFLGYLAKER